MNEKEQQAINRAVDNMFPATNGYKTLRDEIAIAAMGWFIANPFPLDRGQKREDDIAQRSYLLADAMLAAREAE